MAYSRTKVAGWVIEVGAKALSSGENIDWLRSKDNNPSNATMHSSTAERNTASVR